MPHPVCLDEMRSERLDNLKHRAKEDPTIMSHRMIRRVWPWIAILTLLVILYPVAYRITRVATWGGIALLWIGALIQQWPRIRIRAGLLFLGSLPILAFCLPGRPVNEDRLAQAYVKSLRLFKGVSYVWGGESMLGIDCSGLVRQGMVWAQLYHGVGTANGVPIRSGISLWWQDCSANALRDGFRDWTTELFRAPSIANTDHTRLQRGDLAVTADGVHVMAYVGEKTWIDADPDAQEVIEVTLPTSNQWFHMPVVFVRWKWL